MVHRVPDDPDNTPIAVNKGIDRYIHNRQSQYPLRSDCTARSSKMNFTQYPNPARSKTHSSNKNKDQKRKEKEKE